MPKTVLSNPMIKLIGKIGITLSSPEIRDTIRMADAARDKKDWAEALKLYKTVIDIAPGRVGVLVQMGHALKELGQFAEARTMYLSALQKNSSDDDLHLQIGHLEKVCGNLEQAEGWYSKALSLNTSNADAKREVDLIRWIKDPALSPPLDRDEPKAVDLRQLGDYARDAQRWTTAVSAYERHLRRYPTDYAIWAQLGNCRKEAGSLSGSEEAYRQGLDIRPDDADLHLQLGYVLSLQHRQTAASEAFQRSFQLAPHRELALVLSRMGERPDYENLERPKPRTITTFLDISDLLRVMSLFPTVSGIQRVQLGLLKYILTEKVPSIDFVTWGDGRLWLVEPSELHQLITVYELSQGMESRRQLVQQVEQRATLAQPVEGDTFLTAGVIYFRSDIIAENLRLKRAGVRLGALIYDYIPLTHPEFVGKAGVLEFSASMAEALLTLDFAFTISEHVAHETRRLLATSGYPSIPTRVIPLAHAFEEVKPTDASVEWTTKILALQDTDYVLCVGSAYPHKNHMLLLQVWGILIQELATPPKLVLAGKHGDRSSDLYRQLDASEVLREFIVVVEAPSDDELSVLYRKCLFTILPSFVEGWGLPVGESLSYGKACLASNAASIPEVGGDLVTYFDPYSARDCAGLVAKFLNNRSHLSQLEQDIALRFQPRGWSDVGRDFTTALSEMAAAPRRLGLSARLTVPSNTPVRMQSRTAREWVHGTRLPVADNFEILVRPRLILDDGWYALESWGVWMKGRAGRLTFCTSSSEGEDIQVAMQFRSAPWAVRNTLTVKSADNQASSIPVPTSDLPEEAWKSFFISIDAKVLPGGYINLDLALDGALAAPWWDTERQYSIGLMTVFWLPKRQSSQVLATNTYIDCGETAQAGNSLQIYGRPGFKAFLQRPIIFHSGWRVAEPWGRWMSGAYAVMQFQTALASGTDISLTLILRCAPSVRSELTISQNDNPAAKFRLASERGRNPMIRLDCKVGETGAVALKMHAVAEETVQVVPAYPIVGIVGLAFGRRGSIEDRLALAECLLFPDAPSEPVLALREETMCFTVVGHIKGSYSLASMNRTLAIALETRFPGRVRVDQTENGHVRDLEGVEAGERDLIAKLVRRPPHSDGPEVVIAQHWPVWVPENKGDLAIAWVAWEESIVPAAMIETLNKHFQGVFAYAVSVKKSLIDSGLRLPVRVAGCGPALDAFFPAFTPSTRDRIGRKGTRDAPFTFLHVSSCFPRKGVDVLLQAYASAFTRLDPVKLVIKTFPNIHNDITREVARLQHMQPSLPLIEIINQEYSNQAVAELFQRADAVVLPTRGEGFNLPAAEALAAGIPLIVTGHGGQRDFAGPDQARQVNFRLAYSRSHLTSSSSVWAEPDVEDLKSAMIEVAEAHRSADQTSSIRRRVEAGTLVAHRLARRDDWSQKIADLAGEVLAIEPVSTPSVCWISTWNIRCGISEYSRELLAHYPRHARITVLHEDRTPDHPGHSEADRFRYVKAWRVYDSDSIEQLAQAVEDAQSSVVVIQHHKGLIRWTDLASLLNDPRLTRRQIVVELHNVQEFAEGDDTAIVVAALRSVDRVLVHTVNDLNLLKGNDLIDNVALFPLGAARHTQPPPPVRTYTDGSSPTIGTYGFLLPHKGFGELISAAAKLAVKWPSLNLRMVTAEFPNAESVEELRRCRELASSLGLHNVEWITDFLPADESIAQLRKCDLIVLPYQHTPESASAAVRSALAVGVPVAVTPIKIFEDVQPAVLTMKGLDSDALADSIETYLESPKTRADSVAAAGKWLEAHDWSLQATRLEGMLAGLVVNAAKRTTP